MLFRSRTERMRIDSSGNVGIGTSSPSYKLDVYSASGDAVVAARSASVGAGLYRAVGSNSTYAAYNAVVSTDATSQQHWYIGGNGAANTLAFQTNGSNERMRIDSSGNVGIGTSSPSALLDVQGSNSYTRIKATGGDYALLDIDSPASKQSILRFLANGVEQARILSPANEGASQLAFTTGSGTTERMRINSSGQVLVNTTSAHTVPGSNTMEVAGGLWSVVTSGQAAIGLYNTTSAHVGLYMFEASGYSGLATIDNAGSYTSNPMNFDSTGKVGVGTSTPGYTLDVNGTVHYTTLTASSDRRFKKNITPISNALAALGEIKAIRFEWNEFVNDRRSGYELNKPTFGVIAQDVEKVFPELVTQWKLSDDCQDALSVNYEKLIPVLIAAIQELAAKIEKLQTKES